MTGTVAMLLSMFQVRSLDETAAAAVVDSLSTVGLRSEPAVRVGMARDTPLTIYLAEDGAPESPVAAHPANGDTLVLTPFETNNPYLERLFGHAGFGIFPEGSPQLLAGLSTRAPKEKLIAGLRVNHGMRELGVLMVTTNWLRYVKKGLLVTLTAADELWPLDGSLQMVDGISSIFRTADGNQFQPRSVVPIAARKQAKAFLDVYKLTALAQSHAEQEAEDAERAAHRGAANAGGGSTVEGLKDLVALKESGHLSDEEFAAAKVRLLGS